MIYKLYFANAGVAATGLTPTVTTFKKVSVNSDVTPKPTITEIGGGWYKTSDYDAAEDIVGVVDGGAALPAADRYLPIDVTADDDGLEQTLDALLGEAVLNYSADTLTLKKRTGATLLVMDMTENSDTAKSYTTRTPQ